MTGQQDNRPPNVVLVFMDDMGYGDTGHTGSSLIKSPWMDRVAAEGMTFGQMYSAAPICTPSRAALLTGRYAQRVGLPKVLWPDDPDGMPDWEVTLPELLRGRGYRTTAIGKWHLGSKPEHHPMRHGFEDFFGLLYSHDMAPVELYSGETVVESDVDQSRLTRRYTDRAIEFVQDHRDEPFFLYLPHSMPHIPLHVEEEFAGVSEGGLYGDVIECIDVHLGRLLTRLDELGLTDNTLVMVTSDNGPWFQGSTAGLRGRKIDVYEGGIREPFFARWPAQIEPGSRCDEPACLIDLLPTLATLAGARTPEDRPIDGIDLSPVFDSRPMPEREALYFYHHWSLNAVRAGRWKLHVARDPSNDDRELPQLFDIDRDPGETYNLAAVHPDVTARLSKLAADFAEEIEHQRPRAEDRARGGGPE